MVDNHSLADTFVSHDAYHGAPLGEHCLGGFVRAEGKNMALENTDGRPPVPELDSTLQQAAVPTAVPSDAQQAVPAQVVTQQVTQDRQVYVSLKAATYALPEARITLAASAALALLWMVCSGSENYSIQVILTGGIGLTLGVIAAIVTAVLLRRRAGAPRISGGGAVLLLLVLALAIVPTLSSNIDTRVVNSLLLGLSSMVLFLVFSGANDDVALSLRGIGLGIAHFFGAQVSHFLGASQVIGNLGLPKGSAVQPAQNEKRGSVWLGLLGALAILAVVLPLLADADVVFGSVVGEALQWLADNLGEAVLKLLRFLILIALAFALLHSMLLGEGVRTYEPTRAPRVAGSLTVATLIAVLDVVYFIFVCVQFVYLFGNTATPAMHGGYAEYARSGFFELVAVSLINLVVLAVCIWVRADAARSAAIDGLEIALVVLTGVVLVSAVCRMMLYVQVFGLTYQRLLTFFVMAFIAICLFAGAIRVLMPRFPFFRTVAVAGLICWIAFGVCGADARIAEHNVNAYLAGQIEEMDTVYLSSLSKGAIPALERLEAQSPDDAANARDAIRSIEESYDMDGFGWPFWALDCL